jgi:hypothetical protein
LGRRLAYQHKSEVVAAGMWRTSYQRRFAKKLVNWKQNPADFTTRPPTAEGIGGRKPTDAPTKGRL